MQVVGKSCPVCQKRIAFAPDGIGCDRCGDAFHLDCATNHACTPKPTAPTEPPRAARGSGRLRRAVAIGGAIVAIVGIRLSFSILFARDFARERAARDLQCPGKQLTIERVGRQLTARGCDDKVVYTVLCEGNREECLLQTGISDREMTDTVNGLLHRGQ